MLRNDRFESTYEGLKQTKRTGKKTGFVVFESTYEGLKPHIADKASTSASVFESTYEGLKPLRDIPFTSKLGRSRVPMRV